MVQGWQARDLGVIADFDRLNMRRDSPPAAQPLTYCELFVVNC